MTGSLNKSSFFVLVSLTLTYHVSYIFLSSPQLQPRALHSPATLSLQSSLPAQARGAMNAPFATRMWWTQSSTPVATCVSATRVASNSRRWPMPAAPSAGGQSKISSRRTGAHRLVSDNVMISHVQLNQRSKTYIPCGDRCGTCESPVFNLAQVPCSRTPSFSHFRYVTSNAHPWKPCSGADL